MEIQSVLPPPPRYPMAQTTTSPNGQTNGQTVLEMSNVLTHPSGPEYQLSVGEGQNPHDFLPPFHHSLSYWMHQAPMSSKTTCTSQHPHPILKTLPSSIQIHLQPQLLHQKQASNSRSASRTLGNRHRGSIESIHLQAQDRIWEHTVSERAKRSRGARMNQTALVRLHNCRPAMLHTGHQCLVRIMFS